MLADMSRRGLDAGSPFRFFEVGSTTLVPERLADGARRLAKLQRGEGVLVEEVAPEDVPSLPRHAGIDPSGAALALHYPRDGWGTPRLYCEVLASALKEAGAKVERAAASLARDEDGRIVARANGERVDADAVVLAAGIHARALLREAGLDAPLLAYRTQAARILHGRAHELPSLHDAVLGGYMRPGPHGHLVAGNGTTTTPEDPSAWKATADEPFVQNALARLRRRFPFLHDARVDDAWAGLDVATPDRLMLAGRLSDAPGLWLCVGGNGHGFMRAPAVGESLAAMIAGRQPPVDLSAYDPARFRSADAFDVREGYSLEEP